MPRFAELSLRSWTLASLLCLAVLAVAAGCLEDAAGAPEDVALGDAEPFAVLAGEGIDNRGDTMIRGDVGSHPSASTSGFSTLTLEGTYHGANETTETAKTAQARAYADAAERSNATEIPGGTLQDATLAPGVYAPEQPANGLTVAGTLTLDAEDREDASFILQTGSMLLLEEGAEVELVNGANACSVFWQTNGSASLEENARLAGTILAMDDIDLSGAHVDGRVLAMEGGVWIEESTIRLPACSPSTSQEADTEIPVLPSTQAVWLASLGALGGALVIFRRVR